MVDYYGVRPLELHDYTDQCASVGAPCHKVVEASDYDALAARLAEAERTRAKELAYVIEATTAASLRRCTHEARDALQDLRAWATSRATVKGNADSAAEVQS